MTIYSLNILLSSLKSVCCSMSSSNCCFLTCIQISQEVGKVVWYSHSLKNFPQFVVIHTFGSQVGNRRIQFKYFKGKRERYVYTFKSLRKKLTQLEVVTQNGVMIFQVSKFSFVLSCVFQISYQEQGLFLQ